MPTESSQGAVSWSRYWQTAGGAGAACLPGAPASVSSALETEWRSFFKSLKAGSRLLDLGTGGCAVPLLAQSVRTDLVLSGVDYADMLPPAPAGVDVHAGTALESLPFAARSIDVITSQFAIEYADTAMAVAEFLRVLKVGGRVMIIAHHAAGLVYQYNNARLAAIDDMLAEGGLVPMVLEAKHAGLASDQATHRRLDGILGELWGRYGKAGVVGEVLQLLAPMLLSPDGLGALEFLSEDLEMESKRLQALSEAALDQAAAHALCGAVNVAVPVRLSEVSVPGQSQPVAWRIG